MVVTAARVSLLPALQRVSQFFGAVEIGLFQLGEPGHQGVEVEFVLTDNPGKFCLIEPAEAVHLLLSELPQGWNLVSSSICRGFVMNSLHDGRQLLYRADETLSRLPYVCF